LTIQYNSTVNIVLLAVSGKVVYTYNKEVTEGNYILSLNIDNLQDGLYIVKVQNGNLIYNEKIDNSQIILNDKKLIIIQYYFILKNSLSRI